MQYERRLTIAYSLQIIYGMIVQLAKDNGFTTELRV
jgi:hypothetical protein